MKIIKWSKSFSQLAAIAPDGMVHARVEIVQGVKTCHKQAVVYSAPVQLNRFIRGQDVSIRVGEFL